MGFFEAFSNILGGIGNFINDIVGGVSDFVTDAFTSVSSDVDGFLSSSSSSSNLISPTGILTSSGGYDFADAGLDVASGLSAGDIAGDFVNSVGSSSVDLGSASYLPEIANNAPIPGEAASGGLLSFIENNPTTANLLVKAGAGLLSGMAASDEAQLNREAGEDRIRLAGEERQALLEKELELKLKDEGVHSIYGVRGDGGGSPIDTGGMLSQVNAITASNKVPISENPRYQNTLPGNDFSNYQRLGGTA